MSYQVLARKWRPKRFQDVIGQKHITSSLQNALRRNQIGHAYLLAGTRGIGKTSVARIFAKALRCEARGEDGNSCNECNSCLDFDTEASFNVIEIDGASNNRVEDVREIISNVHYLPSSGKYKVYIIDEVHMLSTSAFNALLKTLEEPPSHVVFILATTGPQKLLGTVLSRCQRFDFRNVSTKELGHHLKDIGLAEGLTFESQELIHQLASQGRGSVRDTLSLLDQVLTFAPNKIISEEVLVHSLGLAKVSAVKDLLRSILATDSQSVKEIYHIMLSENISPENVALSLLEQLFEVATHLDDKPRALTLFADMESDEIFWIYETLSKDLKWATESLIPGQAILMVLFKASKRREFFTKKIVKKEIDSIEQKISSEECLENSLIESDRLSESAKDSLATPFDANEVVPEEKGLESESPPSYAPINVEQAASAPETWDGFISYLTERSPASSSNLEQGNLLEPLNWNGNELFVELGFGASGRVFCDYLNEEVSFSKLTNYLAEYFKIEATKVHLKILLVDKNKQEGFRSKAELAREKQESEDDQSKNRLAMDPLIIKAEEIFKSKIDKIVLGKRV